MYKRFILEELIRNEKINSFSVSGKPTKEIQEAYIEGIGFTHIFKKYEIDNRLNKFVSGLMNIYIPKFYSKDEERDKILIETCLVSLKMEDKELSLDPLEAVEELGKVIKYLLEEVYDYYQTDLTPIIFKKVLGIEDGYGKLSFEDMISLIPETQASIAEKVGIAKGTISDFKACRGLPSLRVMSRFINSYPLLPWIEYISQIDNIDNQED